MPPPTGIADFTAEQLGGAYARGTLSPVEALQAVTERIARENAGLNALAVLAPSALTAAGESAQRWRAGRPLGPLDGVPCTIKDLIDVAGLPTRRGSRTTDPINAADDAPLVLSLRAAGAVIVGKTTTTEFGWKSPGDCPLHGITRNPREQALHARRIVVRRRRFRRRRVRPAARGHGRGWQHPHSRRLVRRRRPQADVRPGPAMAARRVRRGRGGRADHTHRPRRGADALGDGALGRARPVLHPAGEAGLVRRHRGRVAGMRVAVLRRPGFEAPADADSARRGRGRGADPGRGRGRGRGGRPEPARRQRAVRAALEHRAQARRQQHAGGAARPARSRPARDRRHAGDDRDRADASGGAAERGRARHGAAAPALRPRALPHRPRPARRSPTRR